MHEICIRNVVHVLSSTSQIKPTPLSRDWEAGKWQQGILSNTEAVGSILVEERWSENLSSNQGLRTTDCDLGLNEETCFETLTRPANTPPPYFPFYYKARI